ncbi:MAG: PINc/VapC family ATPase [Halobacteriaceae archaeon]
MTVVPDTSVIVDGRVSDRVRDGTLTDETVIVPEAVVAELEAQANDGLETGWDGLTELQALAELAAEDAITLVYAGERPAGGTVGAADEGALDAVIRDVAAEEGATLLTSDAVQAEVARAKDIAVEFLEARDRRTDRLSIEDYFDEGTMSVHLKEGVRPMAKQGDIGEVEYAPIADDTLDHETMRRHADEILAAASERGGATLELDEPGMAIVQYRQYRIAVAEPPFSDGIEVTAVRPIAVTELDDYQNADDLRERLLDRDRGVLVAGSPGAGKSTFAQSVAGFLRDAGYVVKTMEKPRDLQVDEGITQYTALDGSMAKAADALLMVRPDYTIYDEVRKTDDFEVFADMRLAGVGMVGVVHATRAIDALQRLVGRVELGMIPQVVDTVVFIEAGDVETVYNVETTVKVPEGLVEEDLARPVIQITALETGQPVYEIYTFNQQVVTVPLEEGGGDRSGVDELASKEIAREIQSLARGNVEVDVTGPNSATVYVSEDDISYVIGKGGDRIEDVENRLGVSIDVRTFDERPDGPPAGGDGEPTDGHAGQRVPPDITGKHIVLPLDGDHAGETVEVRAGGEYLFTATVGRGGDIQVSRGSAIADELERAVDRGQTVTVVPN